MVKFNKKDNKKDFEYYYEQYIAKKITLDELGEHISNTNELLKFIDCYINTPCILNNAVYKKFDLLNDTIINKEKLYKFIERMFIYCKNSDLASLLNTFLSNTKPLFHLNIIRDFFKNYRSVLEKETQAHQLFFNLTRQIPSSNISLLKPYLSEFKVTKSDLLEFLTQQTTWQNYMDYIIELAVPISDFKTAHKLYLTSKNKNLYKYLSLDDLWNIQDTTDVAWKEQLLARLEQNLIKKENMDSYYQKINTMYDNELRDDCMLLLLEHDIEKFLFTEYNITSVLFWQTVLKSDYIKNRFAIVLGQFWDQGYKFNYKNLLASGLLWDQKNNILVLATQSLQGINSWDTIHNDLLKIITIEQLISFLDELQALNILQDIIQYKDLNNSLFVELTLKKRLYLSYFLDAHLLAKRALSIILEGSPKATILLR